MVTSQCDVPYVVVWLAHTCVMYLHGGLVSTTFFPDGPTNSATTCLDCPLSSDQQAT